MPAERPLSPDLRDALAPEPDAAELERVWRLLGIATPDPISADADWRAVQHRIHRTSAGARGPVRQPRFGRRARWAASLLASSAMLALLLWVFVPVTHHAPPGTTVSVDLPDGSVVSLNSGSSIRHARFFGDERAVLLTGEGYFDVRTDEAPFVVRTHNARIDVLGTVFNVRAWDGQTTVALVEGRVNVAGVDRIPEVMAAGETILLAGAVARPERIPTDVGRAAAWRSGALAFDGLTLGAVLAEVERRYATSFMPAPGTPLRAPVSAFYSERPELDALLGDLGAAAGVRFTPGPDGYRLGPASGRERSPSTPSPTIVP